MATPPVITTSGLPGVETMLSYLKTLKQQRGTDLAAAESHRLAPYFAALEDRINRAGTSAVVEPGTITALFNTVARDCNNVILSEFAILPETVFNSPSLNAMTVDRSVTKFDQITSYGDYKVGMGFLQCPTADSTGSVSFPVLWLDRRVMADIEGLKADSMLGALRDIMTAGNHDMLHHLTSTFIVDNITAHSAQAAHAKDLNLFLSTYTRGFETSPASYESWALLSHADTWRHMAGSPAEKNLLAQIGGFFDEAEKLSAALGKSGHTPQKRQKIVDYLTTLCLFSLMRFYPFDAPVVQTALKRCEDAAPASFDVIAGLIGAGPLRTGHIAQNTSLKARLLDAFDIMTDDPQSMRTMDCYALSGMINAYNESECIAPADKIDTAALSRLYRKTDQEGDLGMVRESLQKLVAVTREKPRNHIHETMVYHLGRVLSLFTLYHICKHPREQAAHRQLILDCHHYTLDLLRDQARQIPGTPQVPLFHQASLTAPALANYAQAGYDVTHRGTPYQNAKQLQVMDMAPEIAYLSSPAAHRSELSYVRNNARTVDRGVIRVLRREPA